MGPRKSRQRRSPDGAGTEVLAAEEAERHRPVALVIDEAHLLTPARLEETRDRDGRQSPPLLEPERLEKLTHDEPDALAVHLAPHDPLPVGGGTA